MSVQKVQRSSDLLDPGAGRVKGAAAADDGSDGGVGGVGPGLYKEKSEEHLRAAEIKQ